MMSASPRNVILGKKSGRSSCGGQVSKQCFFAVSTLLPALTSLDDGLQPASQLNPLCFQVAFG